VTVFKLKWQKIVIGIVLLVNMTPLIAIENSELTLDEQIVAIKEEMIHLGTEIKLLEDVLLYPPKNKVALYLSMNIGKLFTLQTLRLVINEEMVANYTYSKREESGLKSGAAQRVYVGNYLPGKYNLRMIMEGVGPHGRQYKRAVSHQFEKKDKAKLMQVVVYDDAHRQQPDFLVEDIDLCKTC